jgi:hypothetical protein
MGGSSVPRHFKQSFEFSILGARWQLPQLKKCGRPAVLPPEYLEGGLWPSSFRQIRLFEFQMIV